MTKAKIKIDSAKAIANIMLVWIRGAASGLRPIDSIALDPISPIAIPAGSAPKPIANAVARSFIVLTSIREKMK